VERFNAALVAAAPYIDSPLFIESHRLAPFTERGTDVAVVLDLMIHDVDLVASLVGRPIADIQATGIPVLTPSIDIANARIAFQGGAVANLTASRVSTERMRKLRIFQRSGYLSLNLASGTGEFLRLKGDLPTLAGVGKGTPVGGIPEGIWSIVERIPLTSDGGEPLRRELESFLGAILAGTPPPVSGRDGRNALATALAIQDRILSSHVPEGSGRGGPGYKFADEPVQAEYTLGAVAMANSGKNTNGSQFFVCIDDCTRKLTKDYNLFGYVVEGMEVAQSTQVGDVMQTVVIEERDQR
jgi:hypothetical protein